jgi:RNA polymerase sigma-70 factor (ECF subfamily)
MRQERSNEMLKPKLDRAVIALANGDTEALSIIYDLASRLIFSTAHAITGNYQDAEDVLQDTFLDIAKYANSFGGTGAKTWILSIARHIAIDTVRKRRPHASLDELSESQNITVSDNYSNLEVFDILNQLSNEERQIVTYRIYAKMPHKEIAKIMEISVSSSEKKYQRAITKLRSVYEHEKPKKIHEAVRSSPYAG